MSSFPAQLALPLETHRNHYLFSDYYLNTLLPRQPGWREADAEAAKALEAVRQLHAGKRALLRPSLSESALEDEWIRPILDLLSHTYHVGASLPSPEGTRTPDYALFPDEATRRAALPHLGTVEFYGTALAVADAKRWDRSLDRRLTEGAGDAFSNANPSYQIDYYLRITGRDWGLLTNGRLWRLYHRDSSFRLDSYYEVDLINLIEQGQVERFKYFYLFFRRVAFPQFLGQVLRESREYAQGVSEDLKERVYEALRLLAEGFLKYPSTSLTPANLEEIHDNALILLYRLLFIFYAESRRLLPLENRSYAEVYSLKAVKEDIADKLDRKVPYLPRRATIWDNFKALFHIINEGSDELGVPAYNGRLFDPTKYPFLEEQVIGDAYLVQALDLLARTEGLQGLDFVDYRDLEIRHLGSIYEGLLEYQFRYADRDMAVVKDRKGERVVLAEESQEVVYPAEAVYLVTDRGERKATGSYYTPDYIVKYIVENTLGPLVDEKQRAIQERLTGLEAKLKKARGENRKLLERELAREREGFGEAVLELKVLDPAMGSGHFLVEATDYLAQRVVDFGVTLGVGAEGGDRVDETEISYWRRRVVESCIYGVDVNPLAVELAKLSLWLATAAKGKPLSFLDHHLRCGNSLIGARLEDLQTLPARKERRKKTSEVFKTSEVSQEVSQLAMWDESAFTRDMGLAVGGLAAIQELASDSAEDIHEKERIFQELLEVHLKRWRQIADLWVSAYFGNEMAPEVYADLVRRVQTGEGMLPDAQAQPYLDCAHALWREKRFFHWELEFSEVFFDKHGRRKPEAGFDALVGNPPMISNDNISNDYKAFLPRIWPHTAVHRYDLACVFNELGHFVLREGAWFALLMPSHLLSGEYFTPTRRFLLQRFDLKRIIDFKEEFFVQVANPICLIMARKYIPSNAPVLVGEILAAESIEDQRLFSLDREVIVSDYLIDSRGSEAKVYRFIVSPDFARLKARTLHQPPLHDFATVCDGVQTADLLHTIMTQNPTDESRYIRALRRGADIPERYGHVTWGRWWMLKPEHVQHLKRPGFNYDSPTRMTCFRAPRKIILRQTEPTIFATIDESQFYFPNSIFQIKLDDISIRLEYLLAILNSRFLRRFYDLAARVRGTTKPQIYLNVLKSMPIRRIAFTTPQEEREWLVEEGLQRYEAYLEHGEDVSVRAFVAARLLTEEEPEQADVIHDLLAHLAEQMIEMHKAKNEEVRGFLDWLAGYTSLPVEEWSLKTNLKAYYEHDWAEMQRILSNNRRRIRRVDVEGREAQERIRREYQASVGKLQPLLARIAATDRLIDLIVYRLYGLTEEEVAVVEGTP